MNAYAQERHALSTVDLARCGLFAALMFVGAKLHIVLPVGTGVTVSLQILFALLAGFLLGPWNGFLSVAIYLLLGLIGLPVYAHGGGIAYIMKPTYGFLIGFATAAPLAGFFIGLARRKTVFHYLASAECAMLSYYVCGLMYFYFLSNYLLPGAAKIGIRELLVVWFLSSIGPDVMIAAAAGLLAHRLVPVLKNL